MDKKTRGRFNRFFGYFVQEKVKRYLLEKGHKLLAENFRFNKIEIDLITFFKNTIYFSEVKYRKKPVELSAIITKKKKMNMLKVAKFFLMKNPKFNEFSKIFLLILVNDKGINLYRIEF